MSGRGEVLPLTCDQQALVTVSLCIVEEAADWVIKRKRYRAVKRPELISIGKLALVHAARRFNPDLGEFERFAKKRVVGAMIRAVRKTGEAASFEAAMLDASLEAADEIAAEDEPAFTSREEARGVIANRCRKFMVAMLDELVDNLRRWQGEEGHLRRETYAKVLEAHRETLRGFPEDWRRLWELRHSERLGWAEVAAVLGISESTAKRRAAKIREAFRSRLLSLGVSGPVAEDVIRELGLATM